MNIEDYKDNVKRIHYSLDYIEKVLEEDEIENNLTDRQVIYLIKVLSLLDIKNKKDTSELLQNYFAGE